jgi:alpha-L-rhamnosidase
MSMLVNSFTFADQELVRRSLVGLGRAGIAQTDINGIVDYSLWWLIAQDQYQLYYGDRDHLDREWPRIQEVLHILNSRTDSNGFLEVSSEDWVFIDWVNQPKWTAVQVMWWWAQRSAIQLAQRMQDMEMVRFWEASSNTLSKNLHAAAWNTERRAWLSSPDATLVFTRHPNFLAVVSGLTKPKDAQGIRTLLEDPNVATVGTPYMAGFEMMSLSKLGNIDYTLEKISEYWGGMIARGATSFWEAYDANQNGPEQYAYYGRPYAKSLSHAWSAGPAAILPSQILGIRPLEDGWKRIAVSPNLGSLKWVHTAVPLPTGLLKVDVEKRRITVEVPQGVTVELYGEDIKGPGIIRRKLNN